MSYDYERRIFGRSVFGGNSKWMIALDSKGLVNTMYGRIVGIFRRIKDWDWKFRKNYARNSWYQGRMDISVTFLSSITGHGSAQLALNGVNNNVDTDDLHSFHLIMRVNVKR